MQAGKGGIKVIPSWLTKRFNSSSARHKRSHPSDRYNFTKLSNEAFYGVYFENSSVRSVETFVYNPVEKLFGMNIRTNVVNNTFKRTKKENNEFDNLVRAAL